MLFKNASLKTEGRWRSLVGSPDKMRERWGMGSFPGGGDICQKVLLPPSSEYISQRDPSVFGRRIELRRLATLWFGLNSQSAMDEYLACACVKSPR